MKRTTLGLVLTLACACADEPAPTPEAQVDLGTLRPAGDVEISAQKLRSRRRMDVAQLDATLKSVMGGMSWTSAGSPSEGDRFTALRAPLGVPDYRSTTHEDLSASILFAKFLEDAAVSVCDRRVEADMNGPTANRIIVAEEDAWPAKIRDLLLLFHGNALPSNDETLIWNLLFLAASRRAVDEGATSTQAAAAGWKAVCVGLVEHPDFATY